MSGLRDWSSGEEGMELMKEEQELMKEEQELIKQLPKDLRSQLVQRYKMDFKLFGYNPNI